MGGCCDHGDTSQEILKDASYRRVLWIALLINTIMFAVEITAGSTSKSVSLLADALDFMGDAGNYAISLFVLNKAVRIRAKASILKAVTMFGFALWVIGLTIYQYTNGIVPDAPVMGIVGVLALAANVSVALMLYRHRSGDSNRLSVWLCSRNDALGNIAVVMAAITVYFTGSNLADLLVALVMGILGLSASLKIFRVARKEF